MCFLLTRSARGDGEEREPAAPAPLDEAGHLLGARHAQGLVLRGRGEEEHGPLREQEGIQGLHQSGLEIAKYSCNFLWFHAITFTSPEPLPFGLRLWRGLLRVRLQLLLAAPGGRRRRGEQQRQLLVDDAKTRNGAMMYSSARESFLRRKYFIGFPTKRTTSRDSFFLGHSRDTRR